jgi:hypothetical protein
MSFRRPGKPLHRLQREWTGWREKHRVALQRTGLPESVLEDEERWWDFLQHSYLDHHSDPLGFTVDQLSAEQKHELRQFLLQTLSANEQSSAIVLRELGGAA